MMTCEQSKMSRLYHGAQHPGHVDGISSPRAVFARITQTFGVCIQNSQTNIQDSTFKLYQHQEKDV